MYPRHDRASDPSAARCGIVLVLIASAFLAIAAAPRSAGAASAPEWRQLYFEYQHFAAAALAAPPSLESLLDGARERHRQGLVPLAVLDAVN